jgi:hypothetical protein
MGGNTTPIFKPVGKDRHDPETHVQVRLLCSKDLPIDFNTGIVFDKNK